MGAVSNTYCLENYDSRVVRLTTLVLSARWVVESLFYVLSVSPLATCIASQYSSPSVPRLNARARELHGTESDWPDRIQAKFPDVRRNRMIEVGGRGKVELSWNIKS